MAPTIKIKLMSKNPMQVFQFTELPQFYPHVEFVLDPLAKDFDWLVVYDDLPKTGNERLPLRSEEVMCGKARTALITYEPSSIKFFGRDYTDQFGMIMTSHDAAALVHPNRRDMPPVGFWYYGGPEQVNAHPKAPNKTGILSVFGSKKRQKHSLHLRRFEFLNEAMHELEDLISVYGNGFRPVEHKAEALDGYKYHLAVENHIGPHHWTEKLSDAFLGYTLPFYVGCPNAAAYFPEDAFIPIEIRDPQRAFATIREAIADNAYEKRLPAIIEARRRVIEDYNLGNMIAKHIIEEDAKLSASPRTPTRIQSRHTLMRSGLIVFLRYALGKLRARARNRRYWKDYLDGG